MSATTAVYDGLEILCALAPNTGFRLFVRNRRSITPPPFFLIGVEPKEIPLDLDKCGGNGFQFPSLYRRKRLLVSCKVSRERQKWFSVSVVVQTRNVFQFPASSAENRGNGFQFPKDLSSLLI